MEQMDNKDLFDGNGKLSGEEMKALNSFSTGNIADNMREQLENGDLAERMDKEINAYLAREGVSDKSKAHVSALYARVKERLGEDSLSEKKSDNGEGGFFASMAKAGDNIADGFGSLWDNAADAMTTDEEELKAEGRKFAVIEVNGDKLDYRTKDKEDGTTDIYIDDNGVNTDIVGVPTDRIKDALDFYKKTAENDMEMDDFSMDTVGKIFDNVGDFVAGDTLDYRKKNSSIRVYMDK